MEYHIAALETGRKQYCIQYNWAEMWLIRRDEEVNEQFSAPSRHARQLSQLLCVKSNSWLVAAIDSWLAAPVCVCVCVCVHRSEI